MDDILRAIIRTVVPMIVSAAAALALKYGVELDEDALSIVLGQAIGALFYAAVRLVGQHFPALEYLLIVPSTPQYQEA